MGKADKVSAPKQKVYSPYWAKKFNPHYPYGVTKGMSKVINKLESPDRTVETKEIVLKRERNERREALKKAKAECVNKKVYTVEKFMT
ncbi:MAG: hypothetical protein ACOC3V_03320 [bacterium]